MTVVSTKEFNTHQKKYLDLAEKEQVVVKRGSKLIELVVRNQLITNEDLKHGISVEEVKRQVHQHIDKLFGK